MLWPKMAKGKSSNGSISAAIVSTSNGMLETKPSPNRVPRPGSSTGHTSTSPEIASPQRRNTRALPPAWEKQRSLSWAFVWYVAKGSHRVFTYPHPPGAPLPAGAARPVPSTPTRRFRRS